MNLSQPDPMNFASSNLSDSWESFKQSFDIYSDALELSAKSQKTQIGVLLHCIGKRGQQIFQTLTFDPPEDKDTYKKVVEKFDAEFSPRKNVTYERFKFNTCSQASGQCIEDYITELRKLSSSCEFGTLCSSLIMDRLVCGINNNAVRERLLRQTNLTMNQAIEICKTAEAVETQIKDINVGDSAPSTSNHIDSVGSKRKAPDRNETNIIQSCKFCGGSHTYGKRHCPAANKKCDSCNSTGHFKKMCFSKRSDNASGQVNDINLQNVQCDDTDDFFIGGITINDNNCSSQDWTEVFNVLGSDIRFKLDTGAQCNVVSEEAFEILKQRNPNIKLCEVQTSLLSFTGERTKPRGKFKAHVKHNNQTHLLNFIVAGKNCLLGLNSCQAIGLITRIQPKIDSVSETLSEKAALLDKYSDVFQGVGCLPFKHKIVIKEGHEPTYTPPRKFPQLLRTKLKEELDRMVRLNVCVKTEEPSRWINNMVAVHKGDKVRICIDPDELNDAIIPNKHPLQTFDIISSRLSDAKFFTIADVTSGFWQVPLDEASSDFCTFQTPFGRYKMLRLPFGIVDASEVFQMHMEKLFGDLAEICVDDFLIHAPTKEEHDKKVALFLERCRKHNLKLNKDKFKYNVDEAKFLGHIIGKNGISPDPCKTEAIVNMKVPQCKEDLMRFLGMVQYLSKFLPSLSDCAAPLREIIKKNVEFVWEQPQIDSFEKIKTLITTAPVLQFYNPDIPVTLQVDASKLGVGACMMQSEKPVSYASATLTNTQKRWSPMEKECYAILFACRKFHCYLYGQRITVISDHKPLIPIFKKPLINVTPRLTRILLSLKKYNITVTWKPGKEMKLADFLSRAQLDNTDDTEDIENANVEVYEFIKELPISKEWYQLFKDETENDPILREVIKCLNNDQWPDHKFQSRIFNGLYNIRDELFVEDGILFFNRRLVVPCALHENMLKLLHQGHFGIEKTRDRARQIVYWPGMSADIENFVKACPNCSEFRYSNQKESLCKHNIYDRPWAKTAMDLFDYSGGKYLLIVDFFSKYFEFSKLASGSGAIAIVNVLKEIFSRLGIPEIVLSDNGPPFHSDYLDKFSKDWKFKLDNSAPLLSRSNGLVEKYVAISKGILRKSNDPFLGILEYRNSPLKDLGKTPNELMFNGRVMRTNLPVSTNLLKEGNDNSENLKAKFESAVVQQSKYYNKSAKDLPELNIGDSIRYRKKANERVWDKAELIENLGNRNYRIRNSRGNELIRNRFHLIKTGEIPMKSPSLQSDVTDSPIVTEGSSIVSQPDLDCRHEHDRVHVQEQVKPLPQIVSRMNLRDRSSLKNPERLDYDSKFNQIT